MTTRLREFALTAGQTLTVDCRRIEGPFGWDAKAVGAVMGVDASNAESPATDADWLYFDAVGPDAPCARKVDAPVGWMRWRAGAAGTGTVRLAFLGRIVATVA